MQKAHFGSLCSKDDIVKHRKNINQLEVLMHHANLQRGGIIGVVNLYFYTVFADFALLRLVQTEQHTHQCGFARTVFTQQCVDFSFSKL